MSAKKSIKVFISDDHAIVRQGLVELFSNNEIDVIGQSGTVDDTLKHCQDGDPDVVVMDLNMDTESGVQTLERVLKRYPGAKVLIFSMRENVNTIRATYQLGARGYITKSSGLEYLIEAVEKVAQGRNYYMPGMAEKILDYDASESKELDPREVLTNTELTIFRLLAEGKSNDEIAEQLGLSAKSVANRSTEIRHKLNIRLTSFEWIARKYDLLHFKL